MFMYSGDREVACGTVRWRILVPEEGDSAPKEAKVLIDASFQEDMVREFAVVAENMICALLMDQPQVEGDTIVSMIDAAWNAVVMDKMEQKDQKRWDDSKDEG